MQYNRRVEIYECPTLDMNKSLCNMAYVGRDSSVGIATGYGLDGPGIEFWWGFKVFPHMSRPALRPT
jgi:hypothetical protein